MPIDLQAKLLRVLEERVVRRLGGAKSIPVDFRLISSTNRSPEQAVKEGQLRQDLYFRINTVTIARAAPARAARGHPDARARLPRALPRQARAADRRASSPRPTGGCSATRGRATSASCSTRSSGRCWWPADAKITLTDLPESLQHGGGEGGLAGSIAPSEVPAGSLEEIERASILKALDSTRWNKQAAAALLGLRRPTLYSKMRKHNIPQRRP